MCVMHVIGVLINMFYVHSVCMIYAYDVLYMQVKCSFNVKSKYIKVYNHKISINNVRMFDACQKHVKCTYVCMQRNAT